MTFLHPTLLALLILTLGACGSEKPPAVARPVRVTTVEPGLRSETVRLTGDIQAEKDIDLAFRIGGRVVERSVNVGDRVEPGQVLARLDPAAEESALTAAKAALDAARGELARAANAFERQESLLAQGFTTRPLFDKAKASYETAQAGVEDAEARLEIARDRMGFTELRARTSGVVTSRAVEPGEVVQAGQSVLRLAGGEGRDAVFDVPARLLERGRSDLPVRIALADDPAVTAQGRIREVASQADAVTRTFRVRVGLEAPPEALRLGSTVNGLVELAQKSVMSIPASALTMDGDLPAVWIVDLTGKTVSQRPVEILRYDPHRVVLAGGLDPGDTIVAAGIQALYPGQRVDPLAFDPALPGGPSSAERPLPRHRGRTRSWSSLGKRPYQSREKHHA
ncbi:efflux RND transporter periplasmic adaptor subunit [Microvirga puerhi]|uniref:Efflux RND transporter periplasmic adaptor subunit n=1 Tax=Microvirga puerhi TaxID=2876078 RepID=A0ABS7VS80_9HYPH|nr:efflux RND transporter periplasmic adaptor subunit [Microvirga puerhi]MBZ6078016.1 efflux RND transporter periplasmic adaptor subunit [Microvirga puerhi]